jgi:hypothetical protein
MIALGYLILKRGAIMGVKMLYVVVANTFSFTSVVLFLGKTEYGATMGSKLPAGDFRT